MPETDTLLLVDDDLIFGEVLARGLRNREFEVQFSPSVGDALTNLGSAKFDYAVVDLRIGNDSGLQLIGSLLECNPSMKIVILTGYASVTTAVEAIKLGAVHYLTKPVTVDEILHAFHREEGDPNVEHSDQPLSVQRLEWEHLQRVLSEHDGNISAAARALNMHRRTLQRKLSKKPAKN